MKSMDDVRNLIRKEADRAGGVPTWCAVHDFSTSYVYEVLRGMRQPSAKLANVLGYRRVIRYEPMKKTKD